jgi:hypothetical protein
MRRLLLDLGNTRLKWRLLEADGSRTEGALAHTEADFADTLESLLRPLRGTRAWVSSVASPGLAGRIETALANHLGAPPTRVQVDASRPGLRLAYPDPAQLGVDRWLAMLGALDHGGEGDPAVVALAGTALTLDAIDRDGRHLGGLIAPGLRLQHRGTAVPGPCRYPADGLRRQHRGGRRQRPGAGAGGTGRALCAADGDARGHPAPAAALRRRCRPPAAPARRPGRQRPGSGAGWTGAGRELSPSGSGTAGCR